MPAARRLLLRVGAFSAGAAAGLLGSFVHAVTAGGLPVGLVTAVALTVLILATIGLASSSRIPVALAAVGWLLPVLVLTVRRPEGDLIVAATPLGYAWLISGTVVTCLSLAWWMRGAMHWTTLQPGDEELRRRS